MPSLSQRYRPHRFSEVTGQAHITESLRRSLATGQIAHAFLLSGPRGVGKTTTARILAQALTCQSPQDGEPCGVCPSCASFETGALVDVIELDAATHTGVELVREAIVDHARFTPMMGQRKVYILDEAHMLSASSWNALLKTLEEPPSHAFFIFATTESHKVPATIVSRCQRYDFRRIADQALAERLREIAKTEKLEIDEEVTRLIVSRSEGCLRDAETLLGQLAALGDSHLTLGLAELIIPPSRLPVAAEVFTHWTNKDLAGALRYIREVYEQGIPLGPLFDDLLLATRLLLVTSALPEQAETWKDNEYRVFMPLVGRWTSDELHGLALTLIDRRRDLRLGIDPLFLLELSSTVASHRLFGRGGDSTQASPVIVPPIQPKPPTPAPTPIQPPPIPKEEPVPSAPQEVEITVSIAEQPTAPTAVLIEQPIEPIVEAGIVSVAAVEGFSLDVVRAKWNSIIQLVDMQNHSLPFILKISRPERVEGSIVTIRFQYAFHHDKIVKDTRHRKIVEEALSSMFGANIQVAGLVGEEGLETEGTQGRPDMVSNILKAFGGNVVE